jgi:hypothetical protein
MTSILDQPIYDPDPEQTFKRTMASCMREGCVARWIGQKIDACPPYRDEDMAISWRIGWRHVDMRMSRRNDDNAS